MVLFPFLPPPPRWIHSGSASSCQRLWNVPARLGHHSPHSLQPQFVIGLQPLDGSYLLFPPAICSQTVTKLLDSMKVHSGPYKPPPPLTSPNLPGRAARLPNRAKIRQGTSLIKKGGGRALPKFVYPFFHHVVPYILKSISCYVILVGHFEHQNHQKYQNYDHNYHSHHCHNHLYLFCNTRLNVVFAVKY